MRLAPKLHPCRLGGTGRATAAVFHPPLEVRAIAFIGRFRLPTWIAAIRSRPRHGQDRSSRCQKLYGPFACERMREAAAALGPADSRPNTREVVDQCPLAAKGANS